MVNAIVVSGHWQQWAACKGMDTELFFPHREDGPDSIEARQACASCLVRDYCLAESAARGDQYGIFGGMGAKERDGSRAPIPLESIRPRTSDDACGTFAGYYRHRRRREEPCQGCHDARRTEQAEYNARRRAHVRQPADTGTA